MFGWRYLAGSLPLARCLLFSLAQNSTGQPLAVEEVGARRSDGGSEERKNPADVLWEERLEESFRPADMSWVWHEVLSWCPFFCLVDISRYGDYSNET